MSKLIQKHRDKLPFIVLLVGIHLMYSVAVTGFIDDSLFGKVLSQQTIFSFLQNRYMTWSSRTFVEFFIVIFTRVPELWRLFNTFLWIIFAYILSIYTNPNKSKIHNWFIVFFIFAYNHSYQASAGWIATTMNYSWPMMLGFCATYPIYMILQNKKFKMLDYILFGFILIIATNIEQIAFILFLVYLTATLLFLYRNQKIWISTYFLSLVSLNLLYIFLSPGNQVRKVAEVIRWFPDYMNLSILRLVDLGISSTLYPFFINSDLIYLVCMIVAMLGAYANTKNHTKRFISMIPMILVATFTIFSQNLIGIFPYIQDVKKALTIIGTGISVSSLISFIPMFIITLGLTSYLYAVFSSFKTKLESILLTILAGIAFLSRFILMLAPTIWASVDRTFIFMQFILVFVSLYISYRNSFEDKIQQYNLQWIKYVFIILMTFCVLNNIYYMSYFFR